MKNYQQSPKQKRQEQARVKTKFVTSKKRSVKSNKTVADVLKSIELGNDFRGFFSWF